MFNGKNILITGGTGSFGRKCTEILLTRYKPKRLIIFSRDELKQYEMAQVFPDSKYDCIRYFIGDVRDKERLYRAFRGIDYVIHAAALKQVPAAEYNPFEAIKTNIIGAQNVINVSIDQNVKRVIAMSTDKAANPINLYGATKLCSDKLFIGGNAYVGQNETRFSVVRYGNVVGSRGSVIPFFLDKMKTGVLPITDPRMTRFWITLDQGINFVIHCIEKMQGGEVFVPKIPSMKVIDIAKVIAPDAELEEIGIRPGEKLHEVLIHEDEARLTIELDDMFVVQPSEALWFGHDWQAVGQSLPEGFRYASDNNSDWLSIEQIDEIIDQIKSEELESQIA